MHLRRRSFLHLAAVGAAMPVLGTRARALDYPARPVRVVVGARSRAALRMSAPGSWPIGCRGGSVKHSLSITETARAATSPPKRWSRAPPDGYTLLLASASNGINVTLYDNLKFNILRDFAPVAGVVAFRW